MIIDGNNLEIKTSYNDLLPDGKTPNKQKLYFSSQSQYDVLKHDPDALLLYIYYERHELEKVYYYKSLIENHNMFNDEYKKIIEDVLDKIKTKKSLDITF